MTLLHAVDTAPLPPAAVEALASLERAFAPVHDMRSYSRMTPEVRRAVIRFENASDRCRSLSAVATTPEEFKELLCVQDELAMCRCQLAEAGRLDLIEVAA